MGEMLFSLGSPSYVVIYEGWPIHRRWRRYIAPYGSPGRIETQALSSGSSPGGLHPPITSSDYLTQANGRESEYKVYHLNYPMVGTDQPSCLEEAYQCNQKAYYKSRQCQSET